ncbi:MAG TPA: HupE/UreJ family protein [Thermoanaerobaculia bacterium]|nr:HupE/UreJ family protein [Thermoanaerobaculia bacterium]
MRSVLPDTGSPRSPKPARRSSRQAAEPPGRRGPRPAATAGKRPCRCRGLALGLLAAWVAAAALAAAAAAHELGVMQVFASFQQSGAYQIDLQVAEEHLAPGQGGGPAHPTRYGRIEGLGGSDDERRLGRFLSDLIDGTTIAFDGRPVEPRVAYVSDPARGSRAAGRSLRGMAPSIAGRAAELPGMPASPRRYRLRLAGWIPGGARSFTFTSALKTPRYPLVLAVEGDETSLWKWVDGQRTSPPFALPARVVPPTSRAVALRSLRLGFDGVLPRGTAAVLFVLAVFLLAGGVAPLLVQLAAFTLGQAAGLALALRGAVAFSPAVAEPAMALAIVYLAVENLVRRRPSSWRAVPLLAFGFLFGMAGPDAASIAAPSPAGGWSLGAAIAGWSLGALAAESTVLAAAFLLIGLPFRHQLWYRGRVVVPASCLIALVGLYWTLERLLS